MLVKMWYRVETKASTLRPVRWFTFTTITETTTYPINKETPMEINSEKLDVVNGGALQTRRFTMQPSAHVMKMFTSQYSNPIGSMVREYGSNMLDAYAKLPEEPRRKPEIHIPTRLQPFLEFKDYGVGMDWDTVWNVFPAMGDSTKRDSNLEIGGFGLGAKTAFGYESADSWTVESRFNGQKMIFNAFHDEDHWPSFNHVATQDTDEPNGITVRVPIAERDFYASAQEVAKFLEFFPMEVEVTGAPPTFAATKATYIMRGESWGIRTLGGHRIVVGPVAYPLPSERAREGLSDNDKLVLNAASVDIFVPIGLVDIVPNREAVIFSERTKQVVKDFIQAAFLSVRQQAEKLIAPAKTEYEALTALRGLWTNTGLQPLLRGIEWKGTLLNTDNGISRKRSDLETALPGVKFQHYYGNFRNTAKVKEGEIEERTPLIVNPFKGKQFLFVEDLTRGNKSRMVDHMQGIVFGNQPAPVKRRGYRTRRHVETNVKAFTFTLADGVTAEQLSEFFGGFPVTEVSELPAPPKKEKEATERRKTTLRKFNSTNQLWTETEADSATPAYFIPTEAGEPQGYSGWQAIGRVITSGRQSGALDPNVPVYAIPRSLQKWEKTSGWQELYAAARTGVEKAVKENVAHIATHQAWMKARQDFRQETSILNTITTGGLDTNLTKALPRRIVTAMQAAVKSGELATPLINAAINVGFDLTKVRGLQAVGTEPVKLLKRLSEKYPMLRFVSGVYTGPQGNVDIIINYLND